MSNIIGIIGLGYVGLPLAIAFSKKYDVIGFDINEKKIKSYKKGIDIRNKECKELIDSNIFFTSNYKNLKKASVYIVAVPTPIKYDKTPDLEALINSSKLIGKTLSKGDIVVYESTVYPGATEEVCVPILERYSGFKLGSDFKVGYSPERINPGDEQKKITEIIKIVSGSDNEALEYISDLYESIIEAGVYKAETIKIAEAAKVVENTQRDVNIAFINEISKALDIMGIDNNKVLKAASTKWNFMEFQPGLVGGHCIGIDPYYFMYKTRQFGYDPKLISYSREINDSMSNYVVQNIIKKMVSSNINLNNANILMLGVTFKKNCNDYRNTKIKDLVENLESFCINVDIYDPIINYKTAKKELNLNIIKKPKYKKYDCIIVGVAHDEIMEKFKDLNNINRYYRTSSRKILIDIMGELDIDKYEENDYICWRL